jgi:hypothetical protein
MKNKIQIHLDIKGNPEVVSFFLPLLNKGFGVCIDVGVSIRDFLCKQVGLSPDYLEDRIQTLFVDGKAVDDFASTVIKSDSVLALSGAMPGLAGATLRRGGFYGKMRGEISHTEKAESNACGQGQITVKLFNLIQKEAGPHFLKNGVLIQGEDFYHRLSMFPDRLDGCESVQMDGRPIDASTLKDMDWNGTGLLLQVL